MKSESLPLSDDEIDSALALAIYGYDPDERYPDYGHGPLREAYRAGWEDGRDDR